jgi:hypothetical protein
LTFANGGNQNNAIPQRSIYFKLSVALVGSIEEKIQSSRWLLKK